jgi:hypothetical protein
LLEPLHQISLETIGVDAIEVVSAKIVVVALVLLQGIANDYEVCATAMTALFLTRLSLSV